MNIGTLSPDELHPCNLIPCSRQAGRGQMEHPSAEPRATDPELDEALARAIRQLIAEAIEVGTAKSGG